MEFDEQEDQEEETVPPNYETTSLGNTGRGALSASRRSGGGGGGSYRYRECQKNHAVGIGGQAVDGCGEFMAAGEEGTLDALKCAACNCHRSFHRKEAEGQGFHHNQQQLSHYYRGAGYLHLTPPPLHQRPLALPSTSREEEDMSNPSSSGGGGGGGVGVGGSRKRFRTRFTQEQKDKMLEFAEGVGWRVEKQDEGAVEQFCGEIGVKRHVLKVWMHNNKHTLGKKP